MKRDVKVSRVFPHPPELVWKAITEPSLLAEWLMPNDFQPAVGHAFTMRDTPKSGWDGTVHLVVLELDAPRRMKWSWRGGPIDTEVTFVLEPEIVYARQGTRLTLEQTGFRGLPAVLVSFLLGMGWASMFKKRIPGILNRLDVRTPPPATFSSQSL